MANHAGSDTTLYSYLVQTSIDLFLFSALQEIMIASHGNPQVAKLATQAIDQNWKEPQLAPSIKREVAMPIGYLDFKRRQGPPFKSRMILGYRLDARPVVSREQWDKSLDTIGVYVLNKTAQIAQSADLPYPDACTKEKAATINISRDARSLNVIDDIKVEDMIAGNTITHYLERRAFDIAMARVTQTASAILEYRAEHGAYPQNLVDLKLSTFIDPYDLKPLKYRQEGKGFVVYAVGPSFNYDGKPTKDRTEGQAVFRYAP